MTSEPLEVRVLAIFDYWDAYVGGEKSKQTDLKDTPEQMLLPINGLAAYLSLNQGQLQIWTEHFTLIFENLKPV